MMKMIPYGLTDFVRIRTENYYYVDKTSFIEKIEMQPSYLFLIRPRRFGKSMTLAMLETYYDIRYANRFDEIFKGLYIGEQLLKYANDELVEEARRNGKLKLITVVWRSWELALLEDVELPF